jgi:hypothetical protein
MSIESAAIGAFVAVTGDAIAVCVINERDFDGYRALAFALWGAPPAPPGACAAAASAERCCAQAC